MDDNYIKALKQSRLGNLEIALEELHRLNCDWRATRDFNIIHMLNKITTDDDFKSIIGAPVNSFFDRKELISYLKSLNAIDETGDVLPGFSQNPFESGLFYILRKDGMHSFAWNELSNQLKKKDFILEAYLALEQASFIDPDNDLTQRNIESLTKKNLNLLDLNIKKNKQIKEELDKTSENVYKSNLDVIYIMPAFNELKEFAEKAITSLLSQKGNYKVGIIYIDDGSKKGATSDYIKVKFNKFIDDQIFTIKKSNGGSATARNFGLKVVFSSQVKYVAFQDADDFSHKDRTKLSIDYLESNRDIDLIHAKAIVIDDNLNLNPNHHSSRYFRRIWDQEKEYLSNKELIATSEHSKIHGGTPMIRTKTLKQAGYQNILWPRGQDWLYWSEICRIANKLGFIDEIFSYYRRSDNN